MTRDELIAAVLKVFPNLTPRIWKTLGLSADEKEEVRRIAYDTVVTKLLKAPETFPTDETRRRGHLLTYLRFATLGWIRRKRIMSIDSVAPLSIARVGAPSDRMQYREFLDAVHTRANRDKYAAFALRVLMDETTIDAFAGENNLKLTTANQYFLAGIRRLKKICLNVIGHAQEKKLQLVVKN